jgi:hypothetical protein
VAEADEAVVSAPTLLDVLAHLIDALAPTGIPYAFGGAIALATWSQPRATADVDLALFISPDRVDEAIRVIRAAGVEIDSTVARSQAASRGMFIGRAGPIRVDVFVASIPFDAVAESRRVPTRLVNRETFVHSPEVLAVFKMLFYRPKDLLDVERMLQVRGAAFDRSFVRDALCEMLPDDERIQSWDEICRRNS